MTYVLTCDLDTLHHMHEQLAGMNAMPTLEDYSVTILGSLCYDSICLGLRPIPKLHPARSNPRVFQPRRVV